MTVRIPLHNDDGQGPYSFGANDGFNAQYMSWLKPTAQATPSKLIDIAEATNLYIHKFNMKTPLNFPATTANFASSGNCEFPALTLGFYRYAIVYVNEAGTGVEAKFSDENASAGSLIEPVIPYRVRPICRVVLQSDGTNAGDIVTIGQPDILDRRALLGGFDFGDGGIYGLGVAVNNNISQHKTLIFGGPDQYTLASNTGTQGAVAISLTNANVGEDVAVMFKGVLKEFSGFSANNDIFQGASSGNMTATPSTASGTFSQKVGKMINTTTLLFDPQEITIYQA